MLLKKLFLMAKVWVKLIRILNNKELKITILWKLFVDNSYLVIINL